MTWKTRVKIPAPLIAVVVIVIAAVVAERWLLPHSEAPAPVPEQPKAVEPLPTAPSQEVTNPTTWPLYHGGPALTGTADAAVPDAPVVLWQYAAEGPVFQTPVSDESGIYVATRSGVVTALDFDGKERWSTDITQAATTADPGKKPRIQAPVACFRSTVLAGSDEGVVYAFDAKSGEPRWTYSVGGPILGTVNYYAPADSGEPARLFAIKQDDGALHCFDFDNGKRLWQGAAPNRCDGSAAVGDGFVVYGSCAAALHVVAAADGRTLRTIDLGAECQVAAGPALVADEIYATSRCNRVVRADAQTGEIVWSNNDSKKEVFTTPAVGDDAVVFGSEDGGVYALDRASGKQRWRFETNGVPTSAVIAGNRVLVASHGVLHLLDLETGEGLWQYEVSDGIAAPAVVNGMIVVGSEDGTVMAFGRGQG